QNSFQAHFKHQQSPLQLHPKILPKRMLPPNSNVNTCLFSAIGKPSGSTAPRSRVPSPYVTEFLTGSRGCKSTFNADATRLKATNVQAVHCMCSLKESCSTEGYLKRIKMR